MRCISCGENKWKNVDQYRAKPNDKKGVPQGMAVCESCGFVSYPSKWKSYEEIKAHYRKDYRNPPNAANFFTGQRKCNFHGTFLDSLFKEWKTNNVKNPSVFEIGAAYGMALAWLKQAYPGAVVGGTELTTTYRRNAFHEFGIKLDEDIDLTKKHDLIMSYKVAEHQLDADLRLAEYFDCLKDDGYLYISVPTWFDSMSNFGLPGFDLEYYYDTNHINVWTREHFESILLRAGFEIVKKDYLMYDSTYLCKKNAATKSTPIYRESVGSIEAKMDKIKKAYDVLQQNDPDAAIALWPDYPQAWQTKLEKDRRMLSEKGWDAAQEFIEKFLKSCANTGTVWIIVTDLAMRFKQFEEAIGYCENALRAMPENPTALKMLMNTMREIALRARSPGEKVHYFRQARDIARHGRTVSAEHLKEFIDHQYLFNSELPLENESV